MRLVVFCILLILCLYSFANHKRIASLSETANEWIVIKEKLGSLNSVICSRKPQLPYLLDSRWYPMPTDSVFEKCEADTVEYIIATEFERRLRPEFFRLVLTKNTGNYSIIQSTDYYILLKLNKTNQ